jgi:hypothetical protein
MSSDDQSNATTWANQSQSYFLASPFGEYYITLGVSILNFIQISSLFTSYYVLLLVDLH